MKSIKNEKGFTLVEVIVVAVIVAILAAVAIPLYTGYVSDARQSQTDHATAAVASFLGAAKNAGVTVAPATDLAGGSTITAGSNNMTTANNVTITHAGTAGTSVTGTHADDVGITSTRSY